MGIGGYVDRALQRTGNAIDHDDQATVDIAGGVRRAVEGDGACVHRPAIRKAGNLDAADGVVAAGLRRGAECQLAGHVFAQETAGFTLAGHAERDFRR